MKALLEAAIERLGESGTLVIGALLIGVVFGFMAQRSRFCLRSAVIEFARNHLGGKLTVWLFAFATAVGVTHALAWFGWFDASNARQHVRRSRRRRPLRLAVSEWWTIDGGGARDLIARTGIGHGGALLFALLWLLAAIVWARRQRVPPWGWAGAIGVGLTVAGAWWFTYATSTVAFDPHPIQSLSFTGPSSEVLNRVPFVTDKPVSFDLGLVPGVFLGSFLAAALFGELKLEGFQGGPGMRRYIAGAMAMGFGGMLAACWRGAAQWVPGCRAPRSSRPRHGSRCAPCGRPLPSRIGRWTSGTSKRRTRPCQAPRVATQVQATSPERH